MNSTDSASPPAPRDASSQTASLNQAATVALSFDDASDFAMASRGLIATMPGAKVEVNGHTAWDCANHDFLRDTPAPDTAHPGLWRQGQLNAIHGIFKVTDKVWQVRGYDISNMTVIEGDTGWVLVDVLTTAPTAAACLKLVNDTLGERPVQAVIYTHSHADHYGGILGVTSAADVEARNVRIIAPEGFLREAVNESVIAGGAMARRAWYQFGPFLPPGPREHVDNGLGKAIPIAASGLLAPTEEVATTGTELVVDGIRVVFQSTPNAEAPAEMNFHFPDLRVLCMAENCTHNMHNLYPIRGAQTRDSLAWSKYIGEAMEMWADDSDFMISTHHWPRFGKEDVREFLTLQRDMYRWLHDQAMRLANQGYVPTEIAAELRLPGCFGGESHVHGYYGTVSHNVRSVYNKYLGWYDGNPAHLDPLPPVEAGTRYVEFMGGADALLSKARESFEVADYRWVAEVVNHLVFADPTNIEARHLQADALEQLGYQTESGTWRNAYLMGARELRHGSPSGPAGRGRQLAHAMQVDQLFDSMAVRFEPEVFDSVSANTPNSGHVYINWTFTDLDEQHALGIGNATLHHVIDRHADEAAVTLTLTRTAIANVLGGIETIDAAIDSGAIQANGDTEVLRRLMGALTEFQLFALIEP
ncbi:MAG: alkyl/aryl-sulfatase [Acidimicrobiales bacterium]